MIDGWKKVQVQEICTKGTSNIAQNKIEDNNGDYPLYGASGFLKCIDFYHQESPYIGIVKDGSGVGRVGFYPAKSSLLGTLQYILPKPGFDIRFVGYALKSLNLASYATGAAIPHIYFKEYGNDFVCIPPSLEDQKKVVAELDLLNSIIDKKNQQLRDLDALAQSIFYEMFGDPVTNEKNWKTDSLGHACDLKAGKGIKASELSSVRLPGLYPCFGGNGIRGYIAKKSHNGVYPIIGRQGALCGNVQLATGEFYATEHAVVCTLVDNLNPIFTYYALTAMNLNQYATGVAQPGLAVKSLLPLPIVIPPIELQSEFGRKIANLDNCKSEISSSIDESETLFQSRMNLYFGC